MSKSGFTSLLAEDAATLALNLAETLETDTSGVTLPRMNEESSPITGHVDDISPEGITGWVVLRSDPTYRCVVLLKEGGRVLAQAVASQFRGDLEASGVGDGCHAFVIEMPPSVLDGAEHEFSVVEQRTELPILKEPIVWAFQIGEQATKPSPTGPKAVRKSLPQAVRSATIDIPAAGQRDLPVRCLRPRLLRRSSFQSHGHPKSSIRDRHVDRGPNAPSGYLGDVHQL